MKLTFDGAVWLDEETKKFIHNVSKRPPVRPRGGFDVIVWDICDGGGGGAGKKEPPP